MFAKTKNSQSGFTLVESIVVFGISAFILLAVTQAIIFFYDTNEYTLQQSAAISSAKEGVDIIVRDIREATYADTGAYPVAGMSTTSLNFFADVNRDMAVEQVRYYLDGNEFKREVTAPTGTPPTYTGEQTTETVSDKVRNKEQGIPIFTYYDIEGNTISGSDNRRDLAFLEIELIINVDPSQQPDNTQVRSSAALRNVNKPS